MQVSLINPFPVVLMIWKNLQICQIQDIFFYCYSDEQVECWGNGTGIGNYKGCRSWGHRRHISLWPPALFVICWKPCYVSFFWQESLSFRLRDFFFFFFFWRSCIMLWVVFLEKSNERWLNTVVGHFDPRTVGGLTIVGWFSLGLIKTAYVGYNSLNWPQQHWLDKISLRLRVVLCNCAINISYSGVTFFFCFHTDPRQRHVHNYL